jgi:hypothetical protein
MAENNASTRRIVELIVVATLAVCVVLVMAELATNLREELFRLGLA